MRSLLHRKEPQVVLVCFGSLVGVEFDAIITDTQHDPTGFLSQFDADQAGFGKACRIERKSAHWLIQMELDLRTTTPHHLIYMPFQGAG